MKGIAALLLIVLLSSCVVGQEANTKVKMPEIKEIAVNDSVLMELTFNGASPVAAKLYYTIKKSGEESTALYFYTHRLRDNKLFITKKTVISGSLVTQIIRDEAKVLKKAEAIAGYKLHWLDGDFWSIAIHDSKGLRTYDYPELYDQPNSSEIERIQNVVSQIDRKYGIENGRREMKLKSGKYSNNGDIIIVK